MEIHLRSGKVVEDVDRLVDIGRGKVRFDAIRKSGKSNQDPGNHVAHMEKVVIDGTSFVRQEGE